MPAALERRIHAFSQQRIPLEHSPQSVSVPNVFVEAFRSQEVDMSKCWGSFGQVLLFHDVRNANGNMVRKGVGVSIAYPAGVSPEMGEKILKQALGFTRPHTQEWNGVEEGKILCFSGESADNTIDLSPIRQFIASSAEVIRDEHPVSQHERVQEFLAQTNTRFAFASIIEKDVQRILETPEFTGWSAFNENYAGLGRAYIVEFFVDENGSAYGSRPDGTPGSLLEIATDEPHALWLRDGLIAMLKNPNIHKGGDFEDTESVSRCGGLEDTEPSGCSTFFRIMEGLDQGETIIEAQTAKLPDQYQSLFIAPTLQVADESAWQLCEHCGQAAAGEHNCQNTAVEELVGADE